MKKLVLTQKQMISTSKQHVEHPFAGQNTRHMLVGRVLKTSLKKILAGQCFKLKLVITSLAGIL